MACVLSDDEDSDNGVPPHRSGVLTAIASPCKLSMPSTLTSVASLVKDGEPNEWIVRAGDDVPKFLYANGPGRIVQYNFKQVHTRVQRRLVERSCTSAGLDFSDIFALTGEGQRALSSLLGFESAVASLIFFFGWFMKRNLSGKSVGGAGATVLSSPFLYSSVYSKVRHW